MCEAASGVNTKDKVLWIPQHNSHTKILNHFGIEDYKTPPDFVKWECVPPKKDGRPDYTAPFDSWIFKIDQDKLPSWAVPDYEEKRAREILPDWYRSHIEGQCTDTHYITQVAGYKSTQTAGHNSTQTARDYSTQKAGRRSTQKARDYSTQRAGDESTQTAGDGSTQTAGDESTQTAGDYSTQRAWHRSTQTAGDESTQTAGDESTQTAGDYSTQRAGDGSTQTAGDYSTQTAGDHSTQTAGIGSVQIGRWWDKEEHCLKTACRKITAKTADKPYFFKYGRWTLVKGTKKGRQS